MAFRKQIMVVNCKVGYSLSLMQQDPTIPQNPVPSTPQVDIPNNTPTTSKKKGEGWKSILSTIAIVIMAPVIALMLINFVFQSYEVDGPSMETTLHNKDRLIVWKLPKTIAKIRNQAYIPNRGDIIVFTKHDIYEGGSIGDKQLIKRVIGLPGDRVVVNNGIITIFNEQNPNGFNPDEGKDHGANDSITSGNVDITVPEGEVFVSGDNRPNSLDSRVFGTISSQDISGKLEFRVFPFNTFRQF